MKEEIKIISEFPHADYDDKEEHIDKIDFCIEKMPISDKEKAVLVKSFNTKKGIIGRMPKSKKLLRFTKNGIEVLKNFPKDGTPLLPKNWNKYAFILKEGEVPMNKELEETIRSIARETIASIKGKDFK